VVWWAGGDGLGRPAVSGPDMRTCTSGSCRVCWLGRYVGLLAVPTALKTPALRWNLVVWSLEVWAQRGCLWLFVPVGPTASCSIALAGRARTHF
jgi:hypothetical protein